jgi:uncharacterized cupredoxin-like copper-binding protein
MTRYPIWVAAIILTSALLAACSPSKLEPVTIPIEMVEYTFTPSSIEVKVGQEVTLELNNNGLLPHMLMIGREAKTVDNLPSGYTTDLFESAGVKPTVKGGTVEGQEGEQAHTGFNVVLAANGDQATVTFPVTKEMVGEWEMGCFEQNGVHYIAGMKGTFTVKP